MRNFMTRTLTALAVSALLSVSAFAGETKKEITFPKDITVNGTVVKKGTYKVVFDDKTGEMTLYKGKTQIAKTNAHLQNLNGRVSRTEIMYSENGDARDLHGIAFDGQNQSIVLENGGAQAATPQQ